MVKRVGFEPTILLTVYTLSKRTPKPEAKSFLSAPPVHQGIKKTLIDESFSRYEGAFCCPVPWTLLLETRGKIISECDQFVIKHTNAIV